ncbi:ligase-associated DNA damage response endonuclease PdeM [Reichenbachiella ulvae]|uniref:Ligase-associated DNA damage response endonuclease PdeM n=1 Tax=Reichenbachiella ulvae TaxID=2980104 RepID=A0ABT3CYG8_9BACT|nr:ligase-associated DNA damage response endonuclease PdeM [Reichenbachiella ulvae]MCV9388745.1 ligase-associated DNA damage response endonuclease PdeM [Reichenbachiella ulvae]
MEFEIKGQHLDLLAEKAIYWREEQALLLSDLHLGKAAHFRKAGVPVSSHIHIQELFVLDALIEAYHPRAIYFLGDLFHSDINTEWQMISAWCENYPEIDKHLVLGNHDFLPKKLYENANFIVHDSLIVGPFFLSHDREEKEGFYNLSGHVHPGVSLVGSGKQSIKLPCFYFSESYALLPAFGQFTGLHRIRPTEKDFVFVIAENEVFSVS